MRGPSIAFAKSFFSFAGARALIATGLVLAAAALEGVGFLIIVPFLQLFSGPPQTGFPKTAADAPFCARKNPTLRGGGGNT